MSKPQKLNTDQQYFMLECLADGRTPTEIKALFEAEYGIKISNPLVTWYKNNYVDQILEIAHDPRNLALQTGLARRAARVQEATKLYKALINSLGDLNKLEPSKQNVSAVKQAGELLRLIRSEVNDIEPKAATAITINNTTNNLDFKQLSDQELLELIDSASNRKALPLPVIDIEVEPSSG